MDQTATIKPLRFLNALLFSASLALFGSCMGDNIAELIDAEENYALLETVTSEKDNNVYFNISDTGMTDAVLDGDDASFANIPNAFSFTDIDSGSGHTVRDNITGLVWTKCSMEASDVMDSTSSCSGTPATYNWADAVDSCANLSYAGKDDWRLPTAPEIFTIMNFDYKTGVITDSTYFPNTQDVYWTRSTATWLGFELVWSSSFTASSLTALQQAFDSESHYVRCVRGPDY